MIERTSRTLIVIILAALVGGCAASPTGAQVPTQSAAAGALASFTPRPSVVPSASPVETAMVLGRADIDRPLTPGSYRIEEPFDVPFSIALPTEWTLKSLSEGDVTFQNTQVNGGEGAAWITIDRIDNVYDDPCHGGPITPPVSATVDGLVTALTRMVGFTPGPISDVVLAGYAGKSVEIRNAIDTQTAGCKEGPMIPMWTVRGGPPAATNGGSRENLWVIDVDGAPLLIDGTMFIPATPEASRAEIEQVVQSLRLGRLRPPRYRRRRRPPHPLQHPTGRT